MGDDMSGETAPVAYEMGRADERLVQQARLDAATALLQRLADATPPTWLPFMGDPPLNREAFYALAAGARDFLKAQS